VAGGARNAQAPIGSNTKVFTAAALGILVDEGKIRWDAPVIDYVPWFQMSDSYVTREMTVRDLLVRRRRKRCCSGCPTSSTGGAARRTA
jgi:CubicO group peptidase (beta-lactamase class C family)